MVFKIKIINAFIIRFSLCCGNSLYGLSFTVLNSCCSRLCHILLNTAEPELQVFCITAEAFDNTVVVLEVYAGIFKVFMQNRNVGIGFFVKIAKLS